MSEGAISIKKSLLFGLTLALILSLAFASVASAHHRPGHDRGGGKEDGGGTTGAKIGLIQCNDAAAKWRVDPRDPDANHDGLVDVVTYGIVDVSGTGVADSVRAALDEWNTVQSVYDLQEVDSGEDVLIELYFKVVPGYILGYAIPTCEEGEAGDIASAYIALGVKGMSGKGVQNLAAHEIGHTLGHGHADKKGDLMYGSFDQKEERKRVVCPSNLDVGALTAEGTEYSVAEWQKLKCD